METAARYADRRTGRWRCAPTVGLLVATALVTGAGAPAQAPVPGHAPSFERDVRPPVPSVRHADRVRTPIDAFILAKLEAAGLTLSPDADRETLIRRATFDLTGLPPTPEEVDAFLADPRADAYERLIDRLLASP